MEIILAIVVFGVLIAGMAVGVLLGRKPIAGSCGGIGAALNEEDYVCDICGGDPNKCEEASEDDKNDTLLAYDPMAVNGVLAGKSPDKR